MNKQQKNPLDKLFEGVLSPQNEAPNSAFLQDLEARLDALEKKKPKPLFAWWIWSVLGAVLLVSGTIGYFSNSQTQHHSSIASKKEEAKRSAQNQIQNSRNTTSSRISSSQSLNPISNQFQNRNQASTQAVLLNQSTPQPGNESQNSIKPIFSNVTSTQSSNEMGTTIQSSNIIQTFNQSSTESSVETTVVKPVQVEIAAAPTNEMVGKEIQLDQLHPKQGQTKHSVGLQFGVSGIFSSFEVPESTAALAGYDPHLYRNFRSVSERQTSSWDFNIRYQYHLKNLVIQTGVQYLEWGEQYKYDVISVEGTNRYQYVQVPLSLAYQIPLKKIVFQPSVGFAMGYGLKTSGAYIQPLLNQVELVSSQKWSKNGQLQLELIYSVSDHVNVSIAPIYRRTFGNLVDNGTIMNRYQSVGLLTGFSFKF